MGSRISDLDCGISKNMEPYRRIGYRPAAKTELCYYNSTSLSASEAAHMLHSRSACSVGLLPPHLETITFRTAPPEFNERRRKFSNSRLEARAPEIFSFQSRKE